MKKAISLLLSAAVIIGSAVNAFAVEDSAFSETNTENDIVITMQIGNAMMTVNGASKEIDPGEGTVPVIVNERTLLPVRAMVEELGGTAEWNGDTREVTLKLDNDTIVLTIDSTTAYLNGEERTLDTAPEMINDRTMMPIRFIAEGFGCNVEWTQETETVTVTRSMISATAAPTAQPTDAAETAAPTEAATVQPTETAVPADNEKEESRALVVYFSATGNTESMAKTIAEVTGAEMYEIVPEVPYTSADLNYNDDDCRANQEMNDESARPAISGTIENMDKYDVIYLGYPIWWGTMPRIINTFLDTYDMSGKTIMPFCTSGSSSISTSVTQMRSICTDADVKDGLRGSSSVSESQIESWIESSKSE